CDAAAALGGIGLAIVALAADAPRVLHNRADGESALLGALAPSLDLDGGLPSFVLGGPEAALLALSLLAVAARGLWRGGREPGARVARVDVVAGELDLGSAYLREGQPAPVIPLLLPAGARRLALIASGVQGAARVDAAHLVPEALVPRSLRGAFAWPRVAER